MNKRVLFSDNGTLKDFSTAMDEYKTAGKEFTFTKDEDFLFIGSRLPFNHIYFKLENANTVECETKAQYWDGTAWIDFVETIDETSGFTKSGFLTFVPNRDKSWRRSSTNYSGETVQGLETLTIYDLFWVRISFTQTFIGPEVVPATDPVTYLPVSLKWLGQLFSNDYDLEGEYPDFVRANVKQAFKAGKTDWEEQHVIAAAILVDDLVKKAIVHDGSQILNRSDYRLAAVHKTAEIICNAFGDDYVDQKKGAREEYQQRMNKRVHVVDVNKNGGEEVVERNNTTGWIIR